MSTSQPIGRERATCLRATVESSQINNEVVITEKPKIAKEKKQKLRVSPFE